MLELITGEGIKERVHREAREKESRRSEPPTTSNSIPVVRERAINQVETEEKELVRTTSWLSVSRSSYETVHADRTDPGTAKTVDEKRIAGGKFDRYRTLR